jgi:hypothetical protein
MPKKRTMAPMEIQPSSEWRNAPAPMTTLSAKKSKTLRAPRSALAQSNAETTRRSALAKQRRQIEAVVESKPRRPT